VRILSYNPGHDGAIACIEDGRLLFSIEAEKNSNYRYSPISSRDVFHALGELETAPDVVCTGGWWPREQRGLGAMDYVGYRGIDRAEILVAEQRLLGKRVRLFSSSHERSHLLCAFGLSHLSKGTPCYALVWEGTIGAFYKIDTELNITLLGDVLSEPGNRYSAVYGLADPLFPKDAPFSRFSDAGKLMALASFSTRSRATRDEERLIDFLLSAAHVQLSLYDDLNTAPHLNVGVQDEEFRNFAGIFSNRIFEMFHRFARENMREKLPLVIAGGCGLNCDWNSMWRSTGLFEDIFIPPVANDSGSAIGTAIDAQFHFTGNPKIEWSVYAGLDFLAAGPFEAEAYDCYEPDYELLADLLARELILGWVSGRYEIGPRALGNRSILAAPFEDRTRIRLNEIKQREQFRPIAPVCLEEDAAIWFGCDRPSPYMLFTHRATTDRLVAVTHVNDTARLQTVSPASNPPLHALLTAFKARTGFGVLCNTSLNFHGRGFINTIGDLSGYAIEHGLDGFVVEGRIYVRKASERYQAYLAAPGVLPWRSTIGMREPGCDGKKSAG
jgi:hydroxymethyl cephem carbamoyltransferase